MSSLHLIPPARRRRMARLLLAPAFLLLALGLTPLLAAGGAGWIALGVIIALTGLVLGVIAIGLRHSAVLDQRQVAAAAAETALDEAILTSPALAGMGCGENCQSCGVDDCAVKALPRA